MLLQNRRVAAVLHFIVQALHKAAIGIDPVNLLASMPRATACLCNLQQMLLQNSMSSS